MLSGWETVSPFSLTCLLPLDAVLTFAQQTMQSLRTQATAPAMAIIDSWDLAESLSQAEALEPTSAAYNKNSVLRAKNTLTASRWAHATGAKMQLYTLLSRVFWLLFVHGISRWVWCEDGLNKKSKP